MASGLPCGIPRYNEPVLRRGSVFLAGYTISVYHNTRPQQDKGPRDEVYFNIIFGVLFACPGDK